MEGDIEDGDFGRGGLGREGRRWLGERNKLKVSVEVTVEDVFPTLLKVLENEFPERDTRDFGLPLYDGVISDEEFVLLYNEI